MDSRRPIYRPPAPPPARRHPRSVYLRRRLIVGFVAAFLLTLLYLGVSLGFAMTNQGLGASYSARAAEWGRTNGMGWAVTWVETEWYKLNPAPKGGKPGSNAFSTNPDRIKVPKGVAHTPWPKRMVSPVGTWLPGEGIWHPVGRLTAKGVPAIFVTHVRVDKVHTSQVAGVAWMDSTLLRAQLYSGSFIPGPLPGGKAYQYSAPISSFNSRTLVAAFNSGFRIQDANGGYYTQGITVKPLRKGAASIVVYKDGALTIGKWGRDVKMTNQVVSVRQNLDLIVDHSKVVAGLNTSNSLKWGKVLGGSFNVWRSGLGVTKNGAYVYVGGPALSISSLAHLLVLAGAVRGMELDINTDWVQYASYSGTLGKAVNGGNGTNLLRQMSYSPSRFFAKWMNRDFYVMQLTK